MTARCLRGSARTSQRHAHAEPDGARIAKRDQAAGGDARFHDGVGEVSLVIVLKSGSIVGVRVAWSDSHTDTRLFIGQLDRFCTRGQDFLAKFDLSIAHIELAQLQPGRRV